MIKRANEINKPMRKDVAIYNDLISIMERNSNDIYDILDVLISLLNDKQLEEIEDVIVNQYSED